MWRERFEPGLLQVFRLYAWLQVAAFFIFPLPEYWHQLPSQPRIPWLVPLSMGVSFVTLLVLLYSRWLQEKLRQRLIPVAIGVAAIGLLLSQRLLFTRAFVWQFYPFQTVLLILVAWQYRFRIVAVFALGMTIVPLTINAIFLSPAFPGPVGPSQPSEADMQAFRTAFAYLLVITTTFTFLLIGYVVSRLVNAQREQRQALADANQRLVNHAATLEQLAVSRERNRLSRELHDTLAHTLSAQAVQIEALLTIGSGLPPKAQTILEQMLVSTRAGLDETRRVLSSLRSGPLDEMGLTEAVRAYTEDFCARHGLKLHLDLPEVIDDLPLEVEQCFYRVVQEGLENAGRHAGGQRLELRLARQPGGLYMEISDDGQGFDLDSVVPDGRLGIKGMRERAEMVGAHLKITSRPGQGTTIRLDWEARV